MHREALDTMSTHHSYVLHARDTLLAYTRHKCGEDALVRRALSRAEQSHQGQTRDGGEPYIIHPIRVATHFLALWPGLVAQEQIASAVLHDVLEDDRTLRYEDLVAEFGPEVASAVEALSKDTAEHVLSPGEYRERILAAPPFVRLIKLCDRLDNILSLRSCPDHDKVRRYLERTEAYYRVIGESVDRALLDIILKAIEELKVACGEG